MRQKCHKSKKKYGTERVFFSKSELQRMVKGIPLYSQAAAAVCHRLYAAIRAKVTAKKQGRNCGFPRFKSICRMKSLYYPQFGFHLRDKLAVAPFGEMAIKKHREINGRIKTLALKRESSGKFFAIFCAEVEAKLKIARAYEALANSRHDFLHKTANSLISSYSFIALEELQAQEMAQRNYGKWINDAAWDMFSRILAYKAESAGCKVVFVNPNGTTKECSACGMEVPKSIRERMHMCPACGLTIDRDLNASINILNRATAGIAGSNACGDGSKKEPSWKQEANAFGRG